MARTWGCSIERKACFDLDTSFAQLAHSSYITLHTR